MTKFNSNKGSVAIVIAFAMIGLLGITALVTDIGMIAYNKSDVQNACDAAALAGAQELPDNTNAKNVATDYANNNNVQNPTITINNDDDMITVKGQREVKYFFARVLGLDKTTVTVQSTAVVGPLSKVYKGIRPFAVIKSAYKKLERIKLKVGEEDSTNGNFYALAIDGNGADIYEKTILNGSKTGLSIGYYVLTQTGNITQKTIKSINSLIDACDHDPKCTHENFNPDCSRIIIVPLIDSMEVNGKKEVLVTGFAKFFIDEIKKEGGAGHTNIYGYFIEDVDVGDIDQGASNYGLTGIKLIN